MNGVNGNIVGVDPLLAPLGDDGGPTQTMAPCPAVRPSTRAGPSPCSRPWAWPTPRPPTSRSPAAPPSPPRTSRRSTSGDYFVIQVDSELMAVTALTLNADGTATLMVVRAADGTTAATHAGGAPVLLASDQRGE